MTLITTNYATTLGRSGAVSSSPPDPAPIRGEHWGHVTRLHQSERRSPPDPGPLCQGREVCQWQVEAKQQSSSILTSILS